MAHSLPVSETIEEDKDEKKKIMNISSFKGYYNVMMQSKQTSQSCFYNS